MLFSNKKEKKKPQKLCGWNSFIQWISGVQVIALVNFQKSEIRNLKTNENSPKGAPKERISQKKFN